MATCKTCGAVYRFWSVRRDGLCSDCRAKADEKETRDWYENLEAEQLKLEKDANENINALLNEIVAGEKALCYGVGLWTSFGHEASQAVDLWTGRFLVGILGDVIHSETKFMSLVAITEKGDLYIAHLGETVDISPERLSSAALDKAAILKTALTQTSISVDYEGALVVRGLPTGKSITMSFPACFIVGNEKLPAVLISMVSNTPSNKIGDGGE